MKPILPILTTLLFASACFGQQAALPTYQIKGEKVALYSVDVPDVLFIRPDGTMITVKMSTLKPGQLNQVMDYTGWGRVWKDSTGKHRMVAELVEVDDDVVKLVDINGKRIKILLSKLSAGSRIYVERSFYQNTLSHKANSYTPSGMPRTMKPPPRYSVEAHEGRPAISQHVPMRHLSGKTQFLTSRSSSTGGTGQTYVKGHYRNGKWVNGHNRTKKNSTQRDNWSSKGNRNPYTGRNGSVTPRW